MESEAGNHRIEDVSVDGVFQRSPKTVGRPVEPDLADSWVDGSRQQKPDPPHGPGSSANRGGVNIAARGENIHTDIEVRSFEAEEGTRRLVSFNAVLRCTACMGRGSLMYGSTNHDSRVFRRIVGDVPLGGFFCNGEVGPVAGKTFLHGYTSAFGLFRRRGAQA